MEALLGKTLLTPDLRPVATADALRSKDYVCLYFSAHWYAERPAEAEVAGRGR